MKVFKRLGAALTVALFMSGCSQIIPIVREDFKRTGELAETYGKPEVKKCVAFLTVALDDIDMSQAALEALLAEKTEGIVSITLKGVLIKEALQALNDPAKQAAFEAEFKVNCETMAGDMLLGMLKDARNAAKRLPGVR